MKYYTKLLLSAIILLIVTCISLEAQTNVSGGIYTDTTWSKANSPYIVTSNVVVFAGVTLTIEPGVVVKFYDNQALTISSATFIAEGTSVDSITFTSNSNSPTPGIWKGLVFNNDTAINLNYCNVFYGNTNSGNANKVNIRHSTFNFNLGAALSISELKNNNDVVDSCVFKFNGSGFDSYNLSVSNCFASGNNGTGLSPGGYKPIINCISNFNGTGIDGDPDSIINCICNNNSYCGIFTGLENEQIKNCTTDSNGIGIAMANPGLLITNCQIKYNNIGITDSIATAQGARITKCIVEYNYIGFKLIFFNDSVFCNKICNNSLYDLLYEAGSGYNASFTHNYWCSSDSATISSHIHDGYDNINNGLAFFMPIDTIECYLTTGIPINTTQSSSFNIFPNPASHNLTLIIPANASKGTVKIFNLLGEVTYSSMIVKQKTDLDISNLSKGIYIVEVAYGNTIERQKFVKE